jgi:hypothetical protein
VIGDVRSLRVGLNERILAELKPTIAPCGSCCFDVEEVIRLAITEAGVGHLGRLDITILVDGRNAGKKMKSVLFAISFRDDPLCHNTSHLFPIAVLAGTFGFTFCKTSLA